jgi:ATP-dependent exoDNAse (exonuclease V) alpha subunit
VLVVDEAGMVPTRQVSELLDQVERVDGKLVLVGDHRQLRELEASFASLLLHEGRSVIYVARQLGHEARLTLSRYGHVIDEFEDEPRVDAETAIRRARAALGEGSK